MAKQKEIPVYMFTGFLEAGKTAFIQSTLEDKRFNTGEKTLLLVCEEGEEEYNPDKFWGRNVHQKVIDDPAMLDEQLLAQWCREIRAERVVVEYNGMWLLQPFFEAMPEDWAVYQLLFIADASTFVTYNANMRQLVVDKLSMCQMIAFNRVKRDQDKMALHKIVRGVSRMVDIVYEYEDGQTEFDEIEDPLPFDVNAPVIDVADRDYALLYRDMFDNPRTYEGKTIRFKGVAAVNPKLPDGFIIVGRHVMTCCVEDITYCGLLSKGQPVAGVSNGQWVTAQGSVHYRFSRIYGGKGPILTLDRVEPAAAPEEVVATFY